MQGNVSRGNIQYSVNSTMLEKGRWIYSMTSILALGVYEGEQVIPKWTSVCQQWLNKLCCVRANEELPSGKSVHCINTYKMLDKSQNNYNERSQTIWSNYCMIPVLENVNKGSRMVVSVRLAREKRRKELQRSMRHFRRDVFLHYLVWCQDYTYTHKADLIQLHLCDFIVHTVFISKVK